MTTSESIFRTMFEQAPMGVALIDSLTGRIYEVNRRFAEIAGQTPQAMARIDWISITHPDDVQADLDNMARLNAGEITGFQMNKRYIRPDGATVWISMTIAPITVEAGQRPRHLCMIEDITQRLQMEQDLVNARMARERSENQRRFDAVVEQNIAGFAELGLDARILRVNDRLCEISGYRREELLGLPLQAFTHVDDHAFFTAHFSALLAGDKADVIERRFRKKDGAFGWASVATSLIGDDDGRPVGFVALVLDVSRRRQQEEALRQANELLVLAERAAKAGAWDWDMANGKFNWSEALFRLFGLDPDSTVPGFDIWRAIMHPDDAQEAERRIAAVSPEHPSFFAQYRIVRPDGQIRWIDAYGETSFDASGNARRMTGFCVDVTERKTMTLDNIALQQQRLQQDQLNQQLSHSLAEVKKARDQLKVLSKALEQTPTSVVITDVEARIEYVNPHFTVVSGYSFDDVRGKNPRMLQTKLTPQATYDTMWASLMRGETWTGELFNRRKSGEVYCEEAHIAPVRDDQGRTTHYVAVKLDITERKQAQERLSHLAHHDVLTNLPNRSLFFEHVAQSLTQAARDRSRLALLFIDLDNFKPINDTWGHAIGDHLLQEVAARMSRCVRATDTVGRIGGDEFMVLLRQVRDVEAAVRMADKIRSALNEAFVIARKSLFISSSIGIALYPEHGRTGDELAHRADLAMYEAKRDGRNRVLVFTPELLRTDPNLV